MNGPALGGDMSRVMWRVGSANSSAGGSALVSFGINILTFCFSPFDNLCTFANVLGGLSLAFEAVVDPAYPGVFRPAGPYPAALGAGCGLGGCAGAGPAAAVLLMF